MGYPRDPNGGRSAPRPYAAVPPPAAPRPAPVRGATGQYRVAARPRPVPAPGPRPGRAYRPPSAAPRPQYRPVPAPRRTVPAAPPRAVPHRQWSMPAAAPYPRPGAPTAGPTGYPRPGAPGYPRPGAPAGRPVPMPQPYPGGPQWQQPYGAQSAWAPRPPASSGSSAWLIVVLVAVVVVIALVLAGSVLSIASRTGTESGATEYPRTTTTEQTRTTTARTTTTTSTAPTSGSTPTGTAALQGNPLFANARTALPGQPCTATGWPSDNSAAERFFASVTPCLERAWRPVVEGAGLDFRAPSLLVPSGSRISSPCGVTDLDTEDVAAFYCSSNETMYMPPKGLYPERYGNQPVIYLAVFAHEYGHHVQLISGIMRAGKLLERQYGRSSDRGLEASRRLELEAQCFSGLFIKSVSDTGGQFTSADYRTVYADQERGDKPGNPRDHGTVAHYQGWWNTGYQSNRVAQCNTWTAASSDVA